MNTEPLITVQAAPVQTGTTTEQQPAADQNVNADAPAADAIADGQQPLNDQQPEGDPKQTAEVADTLEGGAQTAEPVKIEVKFEEGVPIDATTKAEFEAVAAELGLTQEGAQKLAEFGPKIAGLFNAKLLESAAKATEEWAEQTRNDEELSKGGDKTVLDANLAVASKAMNAFASPELRVLLGKFDKEKNPNGTGLGNHPEVIRLFTRIGKAISEDNKVVTGNGTQTPQTPAQQLYGKKK